jgi:hypothetical protein
MFIASVISPSSSRAALMPLVKKIIGAVLTYKHLAPNGAEDATFLLRARFREVTARTRGIICRKEYLAHMV